MDKKDYIEISVPIELAISLSEMRETYAPLLREIGNICFTELYKNKIPTED